MVIERLSEVPLPPAVSAGYMLALPFDRAPREQGNDRMPARLVTASECLTEIGPGTWALGWVNMSCQQRTAAAAAFGIDADTLPDVLAYTDQLMNDGQWGWPNLFLSIAAAREFLSRFHLTTDPSVIGIALDQDLLPGFFADNPEIDGRGTTGRVQALRRGETPAPGGTDLGYEILGEEHGGSFHSWHCHDLAPQVHELFGIQVNNFGLIDNPDDARRAAEWIATDEAGAAPVAWRPWRLQVYQPPGKAAVMLANHQRLCGS